MLEEASHILSIKGVRWGGVAAGIKKAGENQKPQLDLALMEIEAGSSVSAVFTQNLFCAAPVVLARKHLSEWSSCGEALYCLINAGNANAGTGDQGYEAAQRSCQSIAEKLAISPFNVLPFSTGVIGEPLPVEKIEQCSQMLIDSLNENGWQIAANAIMTTDTCPKLVSRQIDIEGEKINLTGISKGAGMIKPDMATMLSYIATDAQIEQALLDELLMAAVKKSFNRITVDGDTSTNDACVLAATAKSSIKVHKGTEAYQIFEHGLTLLLQDLATAIIRDAEGATKFITIHVKGGLNEDECLQVAYAVAESPLVKTAFFASDPNWGRILAAVGRSGIGSADISSKDKLDINKITISMGEHCICENGGRSFSYDESIATRIMEEKEIILTIDLGRGEYSETVWTSDLSHDYIRINAEYRT